MSTKNKTEKINAGNALAAISLVQVPPKCTSLNQR